MSRKPKTYKICDNCGEYKESTSSNYCSQKCRIIYERNKKIKKWLSGEHSGVRGQTATAYWIKNYLKETRGEKCELCGWQERNMHTGKIPIELSHKDGNYLNNNIENLELLCPNCHSLTDSYKGANKSKGRPRFKYY